MAYGDDLGRTGMEPGRANSKTYNPNSPAGFATPNTTATPTAAQSITPNFSGGMGGLNNATAAGQIKSGQLHTDVSNFHQWYDTLSPEQSKVFAPNTTDPKGANYIDPVAGGNVAPGPRTADNLAGIQKENARQHFMRTLQLGTNPATTTANTPALPNPSAAIGPTSTGLPIGSTSPQTASAAITPFIGAHNAYNSQLGTLDAAKAAGMSVEQQAAAQGQQAEAMKAKDQIYNMTQSKIDKTKAEAAHLGAQDSALGKNADTKAADVAQKPGIAAAGNASKETIATGKNATAENVAKMHVDAQKEIADAKSASAKTGQPADYTKAKAALEKTMQAGEAVIRKSYEEERKLAPKPDLAAQDAELEQRVAKYRQGVMDRNPEVYAKPQATTTTQPPKGKYDTTGFVTDFTGISPKVAAVIKKEQDFFAGDSKENFSGKDLRDLSPDERKEWDSIRHTDKDGRLTFTPPSKSSSSPSAAPPAGATHSRVNPQTGKTEYLMPDGSIR